MHSPATDKESEVVQLPCGRMISAEDAAAMPCPKGNLPAPAEGEEVVTLPCGKVVSVAVAANLPCARQGQETVAETEEPAVSQAPAVAPEHDKMKEAMQKMVEATDEMVLVTRQLVIATQQMLNATKGVAVEMIDTGKEAMQKETPEAAEGQPTAETNLINTVNDVVEASKEVFNATNQALNAALEKPKQ